MKRILKTTAVLLVLTILLSLSACVTEPSTTTNPTTVTTTPPTTAAPTTEAPNEGLILYKAARETLEKQEDVGLVISVTETMTLPAEEIVTNINQDISYVGLGTDHFKAYIQDTSGTSSGKLRNKETFSDGKVYIRANDGLYLAELTEEQYIERYLPVVLIDENLYSSIDYTLGDYTTEIRFSDPNGPENWFPKDVTVIAAFGTAALGTDGKLKKFTYDLTYSLLGAMIHQEIRIVVTTPQITQIDVPTDTLNYLSVPHPDILKMVDLAYFRTLSSTSISCSVMDEIVSDPGAIRVLDVQEIESYDNGSYMGQVNFSREYTDLVTNETVYISQLDVFRNNTYTVSTNGEPAQIVLGAYQQDMQDYIYDAVISGWMDYNYITECVATNLGNILLIEFLGTEELARYNEDLISNYLFDDEDYLDNLASKYDTIRMDFYIAIDTYLGLPTAAGFTYCGYHTINGTDYTTSRTVSSNIHLASSESHMAITGEPMPDEQEAESPTPLFYHVTGENGEEMWLMGTIHVGDERTGNLPQEILDAFASSDALALECNPNTMKEEMKDPAVAQAYASAYYYTDGTTTQDHISNVELYTYAMALMKATGFYNYMMPYLKTSMWESNISKEWLRMSYALSSDKGLDNRLMTLAKNQNKPIREVESNLFQLKMLTGWSDALAEILLSSIISQKVDLYAAESISLYEMWCAGDEAGLKEYLKEDTSELTAEEKLLWEEYNKAMATDRNKHMTEVAIQYLQSGDTVFYAVGLAHVIAEDGLVNALRDAGYTVELVTYS